MGIFYDQEIINEIDHSGVQRKGLDILVQKNIKINPMILKKAQDIFFEKAKNEPKLQNYIRTDQNCKKEIPGCYICNFSCKKNSDSDMIEDLKRFITLQLSSITDVNKIAKYNKAVKAAQEDLGKDYEYWYISNPHNKGLFFQDLIIFLKPKDIELNFKGGK